MSLRVSMTLRGIEKSRTYSGNQNTIPRFTATSLEIVPTFLSQITLSEMLQIFLVNFHLQN